ncbi:MAG: hypothetical protein ACN2B6_04310 [Rickettsiales bacterium]
MDKSLENRMEDETSKINVESYQKVTSLGGWAGGGRTLWATAALSAALGAGIGLVAPFFPLIAGATTVATAVAAIPASVLAFSAAGISAGFAGGVTLGRISGSVASAAEESEQRIKEWTARQILHNDLNASIARDPKEKPEKPKSFIKSVKDNYRTYFNPGIGLTMALIGAAGGLILGGAFLMTGAGAFAMMPAMTALTGLSEAAVASAPVALSYSAGVGAAIGSLWSLNVPRIASAMTGFAGELIGGRIIGREWAPLKEPNPTIRSVQRTSDTTVSNVIAGHSPATKPSRFASFREMVDHSKSAAKEASETVMRH